MDPKSSRQLPATSPSARAVGGSTPGRPCGTATATGPPSRTASAELARTAPLAVARWLWCGDAGTSAGSTGLHNVRKQRSARLSLVLCSGELGGRSVVRRCRLPSVCCLRPPQPVSAPLALVPRDLVRTQGGRPATGATGLHTPPQKRKTRKESVEARCRRCRSPCVLASPAAPPGRACSPCVGVAAAGIPPPSLLAASEENSEKWRLRLPCSAQGLSVRAGQRIQCSIGRQSIERARPPRC